MRVFVYTLSPSSFFHLIQNMLEIFKTPKGLYQETNLQDSQCCKKYSSFTDNVTKQYTITTAWSYLRAFKYKTRN